MKIRNVLPGLCGLLILLCMLYPAVRSLHGAGGLVPSFPTAQGGGATSVGGRGGIIMEVTNLNDSGSGSLRACVVASGPRTCIFRVAGIIPVTSGDLQINNPYITIAGQTAPGQIILGGPTTSGATLRVSTHDVIVRYITFSPDNASQPSGPDTGTVGIEVTNCPQPSGSSTSYPFGTNTGCYNIMFDQITTRWAGNKMWITTSNFTPGGSNGLGDGPNHNITTQFSMIYEPHEGHPVGAGTATDETCTGTISGNCLSPLEVNIDFHHNLFANIDHRIPENSNGSTRWINNIVFNWSFYANEYLGAETIDVINNKYITGNLNAGTAGPGGCTAPDSSGSCAGPAQTYPVHFTTNSPEMSGAPSVYVAGNIFGAHGATTVAADQYASLVNQITGENGSETGAIPSGWKRGSAMGASNAFPITVTPVSSLDSMLATIGNFQHLACDGTWVSHQDAADARIIAQYTAGSSGGYWPNGVSYNGDTSIPTATTNWQDHPMTAGFTLCTESLHDGIPDSWKTAQGLSTTDTGLYRRIAPDGYSYLEHYINGVGSSLPAPPPPTPNPNPTPSGTNLLDLLREVKNVLGHANGGTDVNSPGASGNLLCSNGTNWTSNTPSGCGVSSGGSTNAIRSCEIVIGDPGAASPVLANDNAGPAECGNKTGATLTITAVECYADAGSPTVTPIIHGGGSTSILTGALTCGTASFASGTLNGTPTESNGASIDGNITSAGGTAKYIVIRITRTL